MACKIATAKNYLDLLEQVKIFLSSKNAAGAVTAGGSNTGNGTVDTIEADDSAPAETWTLTATTTGPGATFTVVGSVSGAQANATSGVAYDNGLVSFTISDGATAYAVNDSFSFPVAEGMGATERWSVKQYTDSEYVVDSGGGDKQLVLMGPGTTGADEIYVGIQTYHSVGGDYFNWRISGMTGFSSVAPFDSQPGNPKLLHGYAYPQILLWNTTIPYWLVANGRRFILVAKISTVYEAMYAGFLLPYATPNEVPYPLAVGGSFSSDARWSDTSQYRSSFINPGQYPLLVYTGAAWERPYQLAAEAILRYQDTVWPYSHTRYSYGGAVYDQVWRKMSANLDGTVPVFPAIVNLSTGGNRLIGEFQGAMAVSGYGVSTEDTITIGGDTYRVFQQAFRTGTWNYWALKLE